ncbi:MAG: hypothetical protein J2P52_02065 [Blastocatellia bacterium]|nr:hypothetical protein [Blastocatellia bacterium]
MSKNQKPDSTPAPMPAPQLPNIPISPDDPFQSDPDLLPPIAPAPDPDPTPIGKTPGSRANQAPKPDDPDNSGDEPDDMKPVSNSTGS